MIRLFLRVHKQWVLLCMAVAVLLILRVCLAGTFRFAFLGWNMFLAAVPLFCSLGLRRRDRSIRGWIWAAAWLLFFPNAAYLLTDLMHLRPQKSFVFWVDLLLLCTAAVAGASAGFISMRRAEDWLFARVPFVSRRLLTVSLLLACGYGIYLGRVERWNCWDICVQPGELLLAMAGHMLHPIRYYEVWAFTLLFGGVLLVLYQFFGRRRITVL